VVVTYKHKEAFCLMQYQCETCKMIEVVWNSRDGVSPFSIPCCKKKNGYQCTGVMSHVNWHQDRRLKHIRMKDGQRYFVDLGFVKANEMAFDSCTKLQQAGRLSSDDFDTKHAALAKCFFKNGTEPDLVVYTTPVTIEEGVPA